MGKIMKEGKQYGVGGTQKADEITYGTGTVADALNNLNGLNSEIVTVNGTTATDGSITVSKTKKYSNIFILTNVSSDLSKPYSVTVMNWNNADATVKIRIRKMSDNSAVASTSVNFTALLIGN